MTKEDILEIDSHCAKSGITRAAYLRELGQSQNAYYNARRRHFRDFKERSTDHLAEGSSTDQPPSGSFLPIQFSHVDQSTAAPKKRTCSQRKREQELANGNTLLIEMRTPSGTELRIQGQINIKMLKEIIHASGGGFGDV